jgi:subtilisin family serine protease
MATILNKLFEPRTSRSSLDPRFRQCIHEWKERGDSLTEGSDLGPSEPQRTGFIAHCDGERGVRALEEAGAEIHFCLERFTTVVTGEIALDALEQLDGHEALLRIEAPRTMVPELDVSCAEVGAVELRQAEPALRGSGVVVGIVDSGIDFTHPDFCNADGSSRILYFWDQGAGPRHGRVPYGREYARGELDAALQASDPVAALGHADEDGHGTHVACIAAGNGSADEGRFCGIAPDADLIVVCTDNENGVTLGRSDRVLSAFAYIRDRAGEKPVSINISLGMNGGGHSGETLLESGLDNLVRSPGVVVVKSAGNEQLWNVHAGGEIRASEEVRLGLDVRTNDIQNDVVELWYDSEDRLEIAIQPPQGSRSELFSQAAPAHHFRTAAGNRVDIYFEPDKDGTGDTCVTLIFSRGKAAFIQPGTWTLVIKGARVRKGRYDAWIERTQRNAPGEQMRFSDNSADLTRTISIPGCARRLITVGAYVTKPVEGTGAVMGKLASFSSRGPTRYGFIKPELVAPGQVVVAARSSMIKNGPAGAYHALPGTSMAAPHVAGAAALILSVRPELTCEQVKQILTHAARKDGEAHGAPNNAWGYGKLDVRTAVDFARKARFPRVHGVSVEGTIVRWETDLPTTGTVCSQRSRVHLQLGKDVLSHPMLAPSTSHQVDLTGFESGTYFFEVIAYSLENLSSVDDNDGRFHEVTIP